MSDPQKRPAPLRRGLTTLAVLVLLVAAAAAFYVVILPGLSVARQEPSKLEVAIATYLLQHSVPASARAMVNPLGAHPDPAAVRAGHDLFTAKCETCHAYDGGGRTEIGGNAFPRVPALRPLVASMSDGEIFYHIRNGIRNTAMPAWNFPDRQVWQLVSYIRHLPLTAGTKPDELVAQQTEAVKGAQYVGSKACQSCQQETYARWSKTA